MKSIKIDEFKNFKFLGNLHLSKNEKNLFYTVSNMNLEKNSYEHRIYKMDLETKKSFVFTNGARESSFVELSDGSILFAGDRENKKDDSDTTKFYRICPCGGEAVLDFTVPALVNKIKQINDDEFLVLANFNRTKELERKLKKKKKIKKTYMTILRTILLQRKFLSGEIISALQMRTEVGFIISTKKLLNLSL